MNINEYNAALLKLGLYGPKGEIFDKATKSFTLVYSMPDGSNQYLIPGDKLNDIQREDVINKLKAYLSINKPSIN